jgi:glycosyltransferase involved in cell wall biosynthesis
MNETGVSLWLVIPAWREAERLHAFAARLWPALAAGGLPVTVQIVDDGSPAALADALEARCLRWHEQYPFIRPLLRLPKNRGKGAAVYAGWDIAVTEGATWLGFCDADGSVDADEIIRLARLALATPCPDQVLVLASRHVRGARARWSSPLRFALSRLFVAWVHHRTRLPLRDTQCGAKFLPASLYGRVRPELHIERFAFDVELLATAKQAGAVFREEPIAWTHRAGERLNLVRDGWTALREVGRLACKLRASAR